MIDTQPLPSLGLECWLQLGGCHLIFYQSVMSWIFIKLLMKWFFYQIVMSWFLLNCFELIFIEPLWTGFYPTVMSWFCCQTVMKRFLSNGCELNSFHHTDELIFINLGILVVAIRLKTAVWQAPFDCPWPTFKVSLSWSSQNFGDGWLCQGDLVVMRLVWAVWAFALCVNIVYNGMSWTGLCSGCHSCSV